jgi:DNA-binding response OmpR family regulator
MILIIEDDVMLAHSIKDALISLGYDAETKGSVTTAIKSLKENLPDLIICDIILPDYDGFYMLRYLQSNPIFDSVGFIFISAMITKEFVIKGLLEGADDYLRKPFDIEELQLRVRNLLRKVSNYKLEGKVDLKENTDKNEHIIDFSSDSFRLKINDLILKNLSNTNLDSKFLAQALHLNEFNFNNIFVKKFGCTCTNYIKKIRWEKAKEYLIRNNGNVVKTSMQIGFPNYTYFITKFKNIYGETPKQFYLRLLSLKN